MIDYEALQLPQGGFFCDLLFHPVGVFQVGDQAGSELQMFFQHFIVVVIEFGDFFLIRGNERQRRARF